MLRLSEIVRVVQIVKRKEYDNEKYFNNINMYVCSCIKRRQTAATRLLISYRQSPSGRHAQVIHALRGCQITHIHMMSNITSQHTYIQYILTKVFSHGGSQHCFPVEPARVG